MATPAPDGDSSRAAVLPAEGPTDPWPAGMRATLRLGGRLAAPVLRWAAGWRGADRFAVITYHRIGHPEDPLFTGVPLARFRRQVHHLARHWNLLPIGELLARAADGSLPPRAVGMTFDDSYRSVYELAWPVLREVGASGMVFVPTGPLRDGRPLWYDRVIHALKWSSASRLPELGEPLLDGRPLGGSSERASLADCLLAWLRSLDDGRRRRCVAALEEGLAPAPWSREPCLEMADLPTIRRAVAEGLEVGSHSVSHPVFAGLDPERVRTEVRESRRQLEDWLQRPVDLFAYPNGRSEDFDATTEEELRRAGYRFAFTTEPGVNGPEDLSSPYRLRRNDGAGTDARLLGLRLARMGIAGS